MVKARRLIPRIENILLLIERCSGWFPSDIQANPRGWLLVMRHKYHELERVVVFLVFVEELEDATEDR